jgi:membrane-bound metal-dependent hydrolase YbcI (DUF457 family)
MPSGEVHATLGAGVGALVLWRDVALHPPLAHLTGAGLVLGVGVLGALLPDVDLRQSMLGRYVPWVSWGLRLRHRVTRAGRREPVHRGLTHRLRWAPLVGLLAFVVAAHWLVPAVAVAVGLAAGLGFLSHLVADRPTWFWREV